MDYSDSDYNHSEEEFSNDEIYSDEEDELYSETPLINIFKDLDQLTTRVTKLERILAKLRETNNHELEEKSDREGKKSRKA